MPPDASFKHLAFGDASLTRRPALPQFERPRTANVTSVNLEIVDRYLLGEARDKAAVVAALLADPSSLPAAAPFYRGLQAVGARAADEALIALRLVLAGREPTDDAVRRLRAVCARARSSLDGASARAEYERELITR